MDSAEPLSSMEPRLRGSVDSTSSPRGYPLRRGITAAAGLGQYWNPVSGAGRLSPVPNLVLLSVFGLGLFAFQYISLGLYRSFFIIGGEVVCSCGYVGFCFFFRRICTQDGVRDDRADRGLPLFPPHRFRSHLRAVLLHHHRLIPPRHSERERSPQSSLLKKVRAQFLQNMKFCVDFLWIVWYTVYTSVEKRKINRRYVYESLYTVPAQL